MNMQSYIFTQNMRVIEFTARTIAGQRWKNEDRCYERISVLKRLIARLYAARNDYRGMTTEQDIAYKSLEIVTEIDLYEETHTGTRGRLYFLQELCRQAIHEQEKIDKAAEEKEKWARREREIFDEEARLSRGGFIEDDWSHSPDEYIALTDEEIAAIDTLEAAANAHAEQSEPDVDDSQPDTFEEPYPTEDSPDYFNEALSRNGDQQP